MKKFTLRSLTPLSAGTLVWFNLLKRTHLLKMAAKWTRGGPEKQTSIIDGTLPELCSAGGSYDSMNRLWPLHVQRAHTPLILTPCTSSSSPATLWEA